MAPGDGAQAVFLSIDGEVESQGRAEVAEVPGAVVPGVALGQTTPHSGGPPPSAAMAKGYEELQAHRAQHQYRSKTGDRLRVDQKISLAGVIISFIGSITVPFVITKYFDNEKNLISDELDDLKAWRHQAQGELRSMAEKLTAQQTELHGLKADQARAFVGLELQGIDRIRLQRGSGEFTSWQSFGDLQARVERMEESVVTALEFNERTGELLLRQGRSGLAIQTQTNLHRAFTEVSVAGTELALTRLDAMRVTEQVSLVFNNSGELQPTYTKADIDYRLSRKLDATQLYVELGKKVDLEHVYSRSELDNLLATKPDSGEVYAKAELDGLLATKPDSTEVYYKTEVDNLLATKPNSTEVYSQTEMNGLLATKADSATIGYSKVEVDGLLAGKADSRELYSKGEVDGLLAAKADSREVYSKDQVDKLLKTYCKGGCIQGNLNPDDTRPVQSGGGATRTKVCTSMGANTMEAGGVQMRWDVNTDLATCEERCLKEKVCVGFTYHPTYGGGSCWLWSAYKAVREAGEKEKSFSKCE